MKSFFLQLSCGGLGATGSSLFSATGALVATASVASIAGGASGSGVGTGFSAKTWAFSRRKKYGSMSLRRLERLSAPTAKGTYFSASCLPFSICSGVAFLSCASTMGPSH
jgi:hypothetical protein